MTFTADQIRAGNANLLKLAAILDIADAEHVRKGEPTYHQSAYSHACGTPACAAGHWRAATGRKVKDYTEKRDCEDFALTGTDEDGNQGEWSLLFEYSGCGRAKTAADAAAYIRNFVAKREAALAAETT